MALLILPILWIACVVGRHINRLALGISAATTGALERILFGTGTGLVAIAYGILVLGLVGALKAPFITGWLVVLALLGGKEHIALATDVAAIRAAKPSAFSLSIGAACAVFAAVALFGCFVPPSPIEWDSMSYHLADPKIYLEHHRIIYLPWESHSNFAFTMEMLYTIGLAAHSMVLAKLFHFAMAALTGFALWQIGRRHLTSQVGALAALIFVSIPLVFWEAGTAYVDLAAAAFGTLALLALLNAAQTGERGWLRLMSVMLGCMISIKATSFIATFLYVVAAGSLVWRGTFGPARSFGKVAHVVVMLGLLAAIVGSPWYLKSWKVTGNPVFPFAYNVFGGKHWSAASSKIYAADQAKFGIGHDTGGVKLPLPVDALLMPYTVTMFTISGHNPPVGSKANPFNDIASPIVTLTPLFLATLFVGGFLRTKRSIAIQIVGSLAIASCLLWVPLTQQERYLMPVYPLLALLSAYWLAETWRRKLLTGYMLGALGVASLAFSLFVAQQMLLFGMPVVSGRESLSRYLFTEPTPAFPSYGAFEFLNAQPPGSGVVLYGEPLGLYCKQPYMWGEPTHGMAIPYDQLATPNDLRAYLVAHGFRYILVRQREAPLAAPEPGMPPTTWDQKVYALTFGSTSEPVYYNGNPNSPIVVYQL